jgi:fermentation-respiration switch protein FrsA (DUF1100 family)
VRLVKNGRTHQNLPQQYGLYTDFLTNRAKLDILNAAKLIAHELHVFHGDKDLAVPISEAYELAAASGTQVTEIKDADHVFGATHPWDEQQMPVQLLELCSLTLEKIRHKKSQ